jgi:hypothetical protein
MQSVRQGKKKGGSAPLRLWRAPRGIFAEKKPEKIFWQFPLA